MEWNLQDYKVYCISIFGSLAMHLETMHQSLQVTIGIFTAGYTGIKLLREYKKYKSTKNEKAK
jgi:hypothetical protein